MDHLRECAPFDPGRLVRGLAALGIRDAALFESTLPGAGQRGRWTLVGFGARRRLVFDGAAWSAGGPAPCAPLEAFERVLAGSGPSAWSGLVAAERLLAGMAPGPGPALPGHAPPFRGGFAVALSYDMIRAEPEASWTNRALDDRPWPWAELRLFAAIGALDHASGRAFWIAPQHPFFPDPPAARTAEALAIAERALAAAPGDDEERATPAADAPGGLHSNLSDAEYGRAFDRLQEYLRAGDLYQANLTRRFDAPCALDAPALYA
ncbi:MAG: hypothetical protein ABIP29_01160, partial [Candidatus Eisenbacteria bacterium]